MFFPGGSGPGRVTRCLGPCADSGDITLYDHIIACEHSINQHHMI